MPRQSAKNAQVLVWLSVLTLNCSEYSAHETRVYAKDAT